MKIKYSYKNASSHVGISILDVLVIKRIIGVAIFKPRASIYIFLRAWHKVTEQDERFDAPKARRIMLWVSCETARWMKVSAFAKAFAPPHSYSLSP